MGHDTYGPADLLLFGIAAWLAAAVALAPQRANSGGLEPETALPPAPRFTNEHHYAGPDCAAPPHGPAEYVPGRDPWGRPVIPAEIPSGPRAGLPVTVEVDVAVGGKHRRKGREPEITVPLSYDLGARFLDGAPAPQDCTPSAK